MGRLVIIAGGGDLPVATARAAARRVDVAVLRLAGLADRRLEEWPHETVDLLDVRGALAALRRLDASRVVLAGRVDKPGLGVLTRTARLMRPPDEVRAIVRGGDDNLLRGVVRVLEDHGFAVLGVHEIAPELMAGAALALGQPDEAAMPDIARGRALLEAMGPHDVGQAAVVAANRVLAVEAVEGTDAMLRRVALLRRRGIFGLLARRFRASVAERTGGVLVKAPKPGQDMRVDMPVIGPRTVRLAHDAGLAGIAVAEGGVLVVDAEAVRREVGRLGLFLSVMPR